jgi:hypothetical protein
VNTSPLIPAKKTFSTLFILAILLTISSCTPGVSTSQIKAYAPLDPKQEVIVLGIDQQTPADAEIIKQIRTGDKGFSPDPNFDIVIRQAKFQARKSGGNAIKIIEHRAPTAFGSPVHRITADILRIPIVEELYMNETEEIIPGADFALLHVFRYGGYGFLISYNLVLGDSVLCKVRSNFTKTIMLKKEGPNVLWAQTEARSQALIDIKFGKEYYLRCSINTGAAVGIPKLELVDSATGKSELKAIELNNN